MIIIIVSTELAMDRLIDSALFSLQSKKTLYSDHHHRYLPPPIRQPNRQQFTINISICNVVNNIVMMVMVACIVINFQALAFMYDSKMYKYHKPAFQYELCLCWQRKKRSEIIFKAVEINLI
jgi:hypothetical protein